MTILDFGDINDYTIQLDKIKSFALQLRRLRPKIETSWLEPADWVVKHSNLDGKPAKVLTITLTPTGCTWASSGGCTMCGEFEGSTKGSTVPAVHHVAQFASAISKYVAEHNPNWIRIYQEGNYTNTKEVESLAQFTILRLASLLGGIDRITIEAMAKYITNDNAKLMASSVFRNVELEVGIGFEAANDVVRNVCVNKGESLGDFKRAVEILKSNGIKSTAYIVLKPPFLTEYEAIEEAKHTIKIANEIGFDAISIEPASIHKYTVLDALHHAGHYQLPWLWSVVEVAKSADYVKDLRIGGVGFYPRPMNIASNRHDNEHNDCSKKLWQCIKEYGTERDIKIFEKVRCDCKITWNEHCEPSKTSLIERIDKQISSLDTISYAKALDQNIRQRNTNVKNTTAVAGGSQYPNS